jgi:hypothetical protein
LGLGGKQLYLAGELRQALAETLDVVAFRLGQLLVDPRQPVAKALDGPDLGVREAVEPLLG